MPKSKPGKGHNDRYFRKRSKFKGLAFRPAETSASSLALQAAAPTVNVQINPTFNIIQQRLQVNEEFPSLSSLNDVLSLDPVTSTLSATEKHSTTQHREAYEVEKKAEEIAQALREAGVRLPMFLPSSPLF